MVPGPEQADSPSTRFERTDVERSLAALQPPPRAGLEDPAFAVPPPVGGDAFEEQVAVVDGPAGLRLGWSALGLTALVLSGFVISFWLGVWWASPRPA